MNGFVRPRFAPTYVGYVFSARDILSPSPPLGRGRGSGRGGVPFSLMQVPPLPGPLLHGTEEREKAPAKQRLPPRLPPWSRRRESAQNSVLRASVGRSLAPCCPPVEPQ